MNRLFSAFYRVYYWIVYHLAQLTALAICAPKMRLGRRRHDGMCDSCDEPCGTYPHDKLDFPIEDLDPDASSSREKLRAMLDAKYRRFCIECAVDIEQEEEAAA